MRIVINALPARVGAGVTFYNHFLPALAEVDSKNEYLILLYREQLDRIKVPGRFRTVLVRAPRNFAGRALWEQFVLPFHLARWRVDILYSQANLTSLFAPSKTVVVVTGANPYSPLRLDPWPTRLKHRAIRIASFFSARRATHVVFISNDSRQKIGPLLRIPESRSRVIYYGWKPPSSQPAPESHGDSGDFVLTVSVLWRHKNFKRLMAAFDRLVREKGYGGRLIIAGAVHWADYYESLKAFRDQLPSRARIEFTESVPAETLQRLYANASLFVFPSVEETLGLPLLEAMGAGLPVAASDSTLGNRSSAQYFSPSREICGDAAVYFDPFDEGSIRDAMWNLLSDPALSNVLRERGKERVKQFTWQRTAQETAALFEELGGSKS